MRKRTFITLALALALSLALAAPALAEGAKLVVTGSATVSLPADTATLEIGAQTRGETVREAHQENARIMEQVIAQIELLGVAKADIRTSQYYVYFEQTSFDYAAQTRPQGSYTVTNMVIITLRDIARISEIIDAASSAGANNIYGLTFQSSRSKEAYDQALTDAVADAKAKAQVLARAAGMTLGGVVLLESADTYGVPFAAGSVQDLRSEAGMSTPILSGDVRVSAQVTLTFALE